MDLEDLKYILCVQELGVEEVILGNHKLLANFLVILLGKGVGAFGALKSGVR